MCNGKVVCIKACNGQDGVYPSMQWGICLWVQGVYTSLGKHPLTDTPRAADTSPRLTPPPGRHPSPWADVPPPGRPQQRRPLKRAVRILLERILVRFSFNIKNPRIVHGASEEGLEEEEISDDAIFFDLVPIIPFTTEFTLVR